MTSKNGLNIGSTNRVGVGEGTFEAGAGVSITVSPFGGDGLYVARATGDLRITPGALRQVIANLLSKARAKSEAAAPGVPGAVPAVADALTALRLSVEAANGTPTRAEWWRRYYWAMVARVHHSMFPNADLPRNPHVDYVAAPGMPGDVISLNTARVRRREIEAERAAIAAHVREGADGQLEIAL